MCFTINQNLNLSKPVFLNIEGKPIPTELRSDEAELRKAIEFDDEAHESKFNPDCPLPDYKDVQTTNVHNRWTK